jgi:GDP-L-fucose synthase
MTAGFMPPEARIFVAGHRGLAGSALVRRLTALGYWNLILRTSAQVDLTDAAATAQLFEETRPQFVFLAAAKVGGILANRDFPADFIRVNLQIQTNVIHQAHLHRVERLLFLGSTCLYPRDCPQPMKEQDLLTGPLEPTNSAYAVAKIAGIEMCRSYNQQHGTGFLCAMPTNLYGPGDNYDPQSSHVAAALIRRLHEARISGAGRVTIWGTGKPRREFMHADDMADACVHLMNLGGDRFRALLPASDAVHALPTVNVGTGEDLTIGELARLIARVVGFEGAIDCDPTKPDGVARKLTDVSCLFGTGWRPSISLEDGLRSTYRSFIEQQA